MIRIFVSWFVFALAFANGFADDPLTPKEIELTPTFPTEPTFSTQEKKSTRKSPSVKSAFTPFTGKVTGDKVRLRLQPDAEGHIVSEMKKNEILTVLDQEGDYYCIEAPESIKAYIFRSFVIDGVVEGNRVNVRLEPDLEAPIIGHLNSGDRIQGEVSTVNRKWLEIIPPESTRFYVAKEFVENVGGLEIKGKMTKRKELVEQLLEGAILFAKSEMKKPFEEIHFEKIKEGFLTIVNEYTDFSQKGKIAKESLAKVQEEYLQKRIAYLEEKAAFVEGQASTDVACETSSSPFPKSFSEVPMSWNAIEEGLYTSWLKTHEKKEIRDFYEDQKTLATSISGILEVFRLPVKNKPGDYVLKNKNLPVAYIYSTQIDLDTYIGKEVTLLGLPRDNHHFAFPTYFAIEVE